jgi:hypothetical protein
VYIDYQVGGPATNVRFCLNASEKQCLKYTTQKLLHGRTQMHLHPIPHARDTLWHCGTVGHRRCQSSWFRTNWVASNNSLGLMGWRKEGYCWLTCSFWKLHPCTLNTKERPPHIFSNCQKRQVNSVLYAKRICANSVTFRFGSEKLLKVVQLDSF